MATYPKDIQQEEAIYSLGKNIVVSASAGAGKTRVLISRLLKRCIQDRIPLQNIIALTFTQAAAAEMKKRLGQALQQAFEQAKQPEEQAYIQKQMVYLVNADITTIDSFCLTIIQKYYSVLGLNPDMTNHILSEPMVKQYYTKAFFKALEHMKEDQQDLLNQLFLALDTQYTYDEDRLKLIININQHMQSQVDPDAWYKKASRMNQTAKRFDELPKPLLDAFFDALLARLEQSHIVLQQLQEYPQEVKPDQKVKVKPELITANLVHLQNAMEALEQHQYHRYQNSILEYAQTKLASDSALVQYTKNRKWIDDEKKKLVGQLQDESQWLMMHNAMAPLQQCLLQLAYQTYVYFQQMKQQDGCMDFSDMERYAYQILTHRDGLVGKLYQQRIQEIMVDEFQDTSDLQNAIIEQLSNGQNIFRVGDVKQSIYRFRGARPALMRSMLNDDRYHTITLMHNYRSKQSIVEYTNTLFSNIMNITGFQDTYQACDMVSIGSKRQEEETLPPVVFFYEPKKEESTNQQEEEAELTSAMRKAKAMALHILKGVRTQQHHFKDYAILTRSNGDKLYLKQMFDQYHIPYDIDAKEGFFQSDVCQLVLSFLHYFMNHEDDLHLLAILKSPYFQIHDQKLAYDQLEFGSWKKGDLQVYLHELNRLEICLKKEGTIAFLTKLYNNEQYRLTLTQKDMANFDYLFEMVMNQQLDTLEKLYIFMMDSEQEKSSEAFVNGKNDDVVTVTTIHHSKGLQYKYVLLWGTSQNRLQEQSGVLVDDEYFIGMPYIQQPYRHMHDTLLTIAIKHKFDMEDLEEFVRIIYVAITRAEERLFVFDMVEPMDFQDVQRVHVSMRKGITSLLMIGSDPKQIEYRPFDLEPQLPYQVISTSQEVPTCTVEQLQGKQSITPSSQEQHALPSLDHNSQKGMAYGTMVHEIFEALPIRVWMSQDLDPYDLPPLTKQQILTFGQSDLYQQCLKMEVHKEYAFYIDQIETYQGIFDFIAIDEQKVIIIDYKTDVASIAEILTRYTPQLTLYAKIAGILFAGRQVETYAFSLYHQQFIQVI